MASLSPKPRRCLLFVPGSRPERFEKAVNSGADIVCIDLEDAVAFSDKASARANALEFLAGAQLERTELALRINPVRTLEGLRDVIALSEAASLPAMLLVPKVACAEDVCVLAEALGARCPAIVPLLESALAIEHAFAIARAPKVAALMLGGADYVAELGGVMNPVSLAYPRARLAAAAASAGLFALDVPFLDIKDGAGLIAETRLIAGLGFTCKSAIHPHQVGPIQEAISPSASEIEHAQKIMQAMADCGQAAIQLDGKLVDRPILIQAQRVLTQAGFDVPAIP